MRQVRVECPACNMSFILHYSKDIVTALCPFCWHDFGVEIKDAPKKEEHAEEET